MSDYRRHDLTDREWRVLSPLLPGSSGKVGCPARNNRSFINGVKWIFRTGSPWRVPPLFFYGHWKNVRRLLIQPVHQKLILLGKLKDAGWNDDFREELFFGING